MPLYEYECDACGHRFEAIQKFSDPPLDTCPKCGRSVRKLVAAPAFQFKGSGWYITDYARKDAGSKGEGASKESEGAGADQKEKSDKQTARPDSAAGTGTEPASTAKSTPESGSKPAAKDSKPAAKDSKSASK